MKELQERLKKTSPKLYKKIKGPLEKISKIASLEEAGEVSAALDMIHSTDTEQLRGVIDQLKQKGESLDQQDKDQRAKKKTIDDLAKKVQARTKEIEKKKKQRDELARKLDESDESSILTGLSGLLGTLGIGSLSPTLGLLGGAASGLAGAGKKSIQGIRQTKLESLDKELAPAEKESTPRIPEEDSPKNVIEQTSVSPDGSTNSESLSSLERIRANTEETSLTLVEVADILRDQTVVREPTEESNDVIRSSEKDVSPIILPNIDEKATKKADRIKAKREKLEKKIDKDENSDSIMSGAMASLGIGSLSPTLGLLGGAMTGAKSSLSPILKKRKQNRVERLSEKEKGIRASALSVPQETNALEGAVERVGEPQETNALEGAVERVGEPRSIMEGETSFLSVLERISMNTENTNELLFEVEDAIQNQSNLIKESDRLKSQSDLQSLETKSENKLGILGGEGETEEAKDKSMFGEFLAGGFLGPIKGMLVKFLPVIAGIGALLLSPLNLIKGSIKLLFAPLKLIVSGIAKLGPMILSGIGKLGSAIVSGITKLGPIIKGFGSSVVKGVSNLTSSLLKKLPGMMKVAGRAGAVAAAGAAGYAAGTWINKKFVEGTDFGDKIGEGVTKTLAFFGNDTAQKAVERMEDSEENGGMGKMVYTREDFEKKKDSEAKEEQKGVGQLRRESASDTPVDTATVEKVLEQSSKTNTVREGATNNFMVDSNNTNVQNKTNTSSSTVGRDSNIQTIKSEKELQVKSKELEQRTERARQEERKAMAKETSSVLLNNPVNAPQNNVTNHNTTIVNQHDKDPSIRKAEDRNMRSSMY